MGLRVTIFVVKDVYERYLQHPDLANLNASEESATETSTSGVLYTVRSNAMACEGTSCNISWRGLTRVAYPDARRCESPDVG